MTLRENLVHEFGHTLHEKLPLGTLKEFDDQITADKVNITPYVKQASKDRNHSQTMENFADTFAMFVENPEQFITVSFLRFKAMMHILEKFKPDYADSLLKYQMLKVAIFADAATTAGLIRMSRKKHGCPTKTKKRPLTRPPFRLGRLITFWLPASWPKL